MTKRGILKNFKEFASKKTYFFRDSVWFKLLLCRRFALVKLKQALGFNQGELSFSTRSISSSASVQTLATSPNTFSRREVWRQDRAATPQIKFAETGGWRSSDGDSLKTNERSDVVVGPASHPFSAIQPPFLVADETMDGRSLTGSYRTNVACLF